MKFRFKDSDFKNKFVYLTQNLEKYNLVCVLEKSNNEVILSVSKYPPQKQRKWLSKTWIPRILFAVTVTIVLIDGYFRTAGFIMFMPLGDPLGIAILYAWALIGILGVHEAGHLIARLAYVDFDGTECIKEIQTASATSNSIIHSCPNIIEGLDRIEAWLKSC